MKQSRTQNYIAGLATSYILTIGGSLIALWLTPYILSFLSQEGYGIFTLGSDIVNWLLLLEIGITPGLSVYLARHSNKIDIHEIGRYASTAFFAQLGVSLLILLFGTIIAFGFPQFFNVSDALRNDAIILMFVLSLASALRLSASPFSTILVAHQQIFVDNLIQLPLLVIRTALTVILLRSGWGLLTLGISVLTAVIITAVLSVVRAYRLLPGMRIRPDLASRELLYKIGGVGIWFTVSRAAALVIASLDRAVAGKIVSLEAVTVLELTGNFYLLSQVFLSRISVTARPALAQLLGAGKKEEALVAYRQMFALSNGLSLAVGLALWAGNREFLSSWVGIQNYGGLPLDTALLLNLIVYAWLMPNQAILEAALIVKPQGISRLIEGGLNLALSIGLTLKFGLVGVALSTSLATLLTSFWYFPILTARVFNRSPLRFWIDDVGRLALLLCLALPIAFVSRSIAGQLHGYLGFFVAAGLTGGSSLILLWFIGFDKALRRRLWQLVLSLLRPLLARLGRSA